jgi:hypothetical protein
MHWVGRQTVSITKWWQLAQHVTSGWRRKTADSFRCAVVLAVMASLSIIVRDLMT